MVDHHKGFTLVELLVVIAIIAVLLSIALPIVEGAIYTADQARCGMTLKSTAQGVQTYAVAQNRAYPHRATLQQPGGIRRPNILAVQPAPMSTGADDRPYLRNHVELKMLLDPFVKSVDLSAESNEAGIQVYSNYAMWWGMYYTGSSGGGGMRRMGSKLVYSGESFRVLASDWDAFQPNTAEWVHASHPDNESVTWELVQQNSGGNTRAMWYSDKEYRRGTIDTNFVYDDGSVRRFEKVTWDETYPGQGHRMSRVPIRADNPETDQSWIHLPRRD